MKITVRRARLFTGEMRQSSKFGAAMRIIESHLASSNEQDAKKSIRALMQRLLRKPSEHTVPYFLEMHRRWAHVIDILRYLEAHLKPWATWQDYFEIAWYKFASQPPNAEFIQAVYTAIDDISFNDGGLAKKHLNAVIKTIVYFDGDLRLKDELLKALFIKFNSFGAGELIGEQYALRVMSSRPRSPQERIAFLRACRLDPGRITELLDTE